MYCRISQLTQVHVPVLRAMLQESEAVVNQKKGGEHR